MKIDQHRKEVHEKEAQIIKSICSAFNQKYDAPFIFKFGFSALPNGEITLKESRFVSSSIINLSDQFYKIIEHLAKKEGVELSWNNTGSTFWIKRSL